MRHVRDCVRLKNAGMSTTRETARQLGVASSTVRLTLRRCDVAGIAWPLDAGLTDGVLEQRLFANPGVKPGHRRHAEPIGLVHCERPARHWETTTFLAALRCDRIEAPWVLDGPIDGESFTIYVEKVLLPTLQPGDIVHHGQAQQPQR